MTFNYNNVYLNETATITGPYEENGPLSKYFDKSYQDLYFKAKTWELAEIKLMTESIDLLLSKIGKRKADIDIHISGDLLNQIVSTNYTANKIGIPLIGVYAACSTSTLTMLLAANMIEAGQVKNAIISTSSHNCCAEKQFRQPVEYGGPKPKSATFTTTGGVSAYLSNEKNGIKITSATLGTVVDYDIKDAFNMGGVMAPAAAKTIFDHLTATKTSVSDYDLILTGDLGRYGKDILKEFMQLEYGIELNNLDDSACMIYNLDHQDVYAGGSGPACLPLASYGYIRKLMLKGKYKKVLLVATGALMSQTMVNEKQSIPAISHAVCWEMI